MSIRLGLVLLLAVGGCGLRPSEESHRVLRLDQAELALDRAPAPPSDSAAWKPAPLPDRWRERRPEAGGLAWYRLRVPGPIAPGETWAVYLPYVNMNAAVWVNGTPVGTGGSFSPPVAQNFNHPLYFTFTSNLLNRPVNELHVRLYAYAYHYGALAPLRIGPDAALRSAYESAFFRRITLSELATALCFVIVLFSGGLWLASGGDSASGWLAIVTLLWGIVSVHYWVRDLPVAHWTWERIMHPPGQCFLLALAAWSHRYVGMQRPWVDRLLAGAAAACVLLAWLVPERVFYPAVNVMDVLVFPAGVYGMALVAWRMRGTRRSEASIYLATAVVALAFAVHDVAIQFGGTELGAAFLLPSIVPLMLASFGSTLVLRFASALRSSEALNRDLERRVIAKHEELERSYAQRRALERAKLLAEERERLVRDMHDGLGGQLVSLLSLVEADPGADPRVAAAVRTALDDMRLVIDSLDPALQTLAGALGVARARFESVLSRSGVVLEWRANDLPATPWLGPQDYLQVLRIVQEALVNAVKHAHPQHVVVRSGCRTGDGGRSGISIEVRDDGCGIDPAGIALPGSRGLRHMRQRAARLSAVLRIEATSPGTRVELWLPAEPPPSATTPRA